MLRTRGFLMLIRYGYEITLNCAKPTAMVCLLSVHDDHARAIRVAAAPVFSRGYRKACLKLV